MHELSLVQELVAECERRAQGRAVTGVQVRCPAGVDAEEVEECFAHLTADGRLAGAVLDIETVPQTLGCECGFTGEVGPDHCAGHLVICPTCARVHEAPAALELVAVRGAGAPPIVL
ncbi:MAG: hydrogenase/urease maturation nickel metallochaperone HypA [Candidatus Dormibacteria bacterium]